MLMCLMLRIFMRMISECSVYVVGLQRVMGLRTYDFYFERNCVVGEFYEKLKVC